MKQRVYLTLFSLFLTLFVCQDVLAREVVAGLNIEGICCTPSCPAFGNNAIHRLGFEEFDMCQDAAFCPLCHGQLHITNAGFHNCCWKVQGIKKTGHPMEMKSGKVRSLCIVY